MNKNKRWFITIGITAFVLLSIFTICSFILDNEEKEIKSISVIVYGSDSERWANLKQGLEEGAQSYNAEVTFITTSVESDAGEQLELIEREINNGADGIIVAVSNYEKEADKIIELNKKVPIIAVESGVYTDTDITLVSADNYNMGASLGERLSEKENARVKIAIVSDSMERDSVKLRYEGFYNEINDRYKNIVYWTKNTGENKMQTFIQRELTEEAVDIVVALDNNALEGVVDAVVNLDKKVKIYGIANSEKAVYYLDNATVTQLLYEDDYSMGFLAVKALLQPNEYSQQDNDNIEYKVISNDEIYLPANERLLFPFVK